MNLTLNKKQIERFSRQIILKDIGTIGQKKIIKSKVLIIGMGGLGCPVAEFLARAGVGSIGIIDSDNVDLSNIHRQSLYDINDLKKSKVVAAKKKLKKINSEIKVIVYNHGDNDFVINNGDRIAQMILSPVIKMELEETSDLPETVRGKGGFGSTGK